MTDEVTELRRLLGEIVEAEKDFREAMGSNWEGDPLSDAIDNARAFLQCEEHGRWKPCIACQLIEHSKPVAR